jgi:hypothetical protein
MILNKHFSWPIVHSDLLSIPDASSTGYKKSILSYSNAGDKSLFAIAEWQGVMFPASA